MWPGVLRAAATGDRRHYPFRLRLKAVLGSEWFGSRTLPSQHGGGQKKTAATRAHREAKSQNPVADEMGLLNHAVSLLTVDIQTPLLLLVPSQNLRALSRSRLEMVSILTTS